MNRRQFIKALSALVAVGTVTPTALVSTPAMANGWAKFNPAHSYGREYIISDYVDRELLQEVWYMMAPEIRYVVPPAYRHKIVFNFKNPEPNDYDPLIQRGYCYWIYRP